MLYLFFVSSLMLLCHIMTKCPLGPNSCKQRLKARGTLQK